MTKETYELIEQYMLASVEDSAHDKEHIYRVLNVALDIATREEQVDYEVLIAACLLHDIGRQEQNANPSLCHAQVGSEKAYQFLINCGWSSSKAGHVRECILTHRFRTERPPASIEAKILFDADKIDATGALGIARTLLYNGLAAEPLYSLLPDGTVSDGSKDVTPSFLHEYKYKLEKLYHQFYTARGKEIAFTRQEAAVVFYRSFLAEVRATRERSCHCSSLVTANSPHNIPSDQLEVQIRMATPSDLSHMLALDHLCRRDLISSAVERNEAYVAEHNATVCAFAILNYNFFANGFVELLLVNAAQRRRGIGLALLNYLRTECKTKKLFTSTNRSNEPMQKLLLKAGFSSCGEIDALDEGDPELFFVSNRNQDQPNTC